MQIIQSPRNDPHRSLQELSQQEDYAPHRWNTRSLNEDISEWGEYSQTLGRELGNKEPKQVDQPKQTKKTKERQPSNFKLKLQKLCLPKLPKQQRQISQTRQQNHASEENELLKRFNQLQQELQRRKRILKAEDVLEMQRSTLATLKRLPTKVPVSVKYPSYSRQRSKAIGSHLKDMDFRSKSIEDLEWKIKKVQKLKQLYNSSFIELSTDDIQIKEDGKYRL